MKKPVKITLGVLGVLLLIILSAAAYVFFSPFSREKHAVIYVDADDTVDSVYTKVADAAKPRSMAMLRMLCSTRGYADHIVPGRYDLGGGIGVLTAFRNLRSGQQSPVMLTVPQVHTLDQLAEKLAKHLQATEAELKEAFADSVLISSLGYTRATLPAVFMPNTYEVYWTITPAKLLERMKKESDNYWNDERRQLAEKQGLTPVEAVTLASIVDQETNYEPEMPTIAGLYLNRLHKGVKLEACPTVKFALGNFALRRILTEHTRTQHPYNTYVNEGLPPGPIGLPRRVSVEAVLHPAKTDALFMCAKADNSGTHHFSSTYEQHAAYGRIYAQWLNERNIRK